MGKSLLRVLLETIDDKTRKIGSPISNLFGASKAVVQKTSTTVHSTWLALQLGGTPPGTIEDFYTAFTASSTQSRQTLETDDGIVTVASTAAETRTFLVKGAVTLEQPRSIRFRLSTGSQQGRFALYVDEKLVRSGTNALELTVSLDKGTHYLEVLATSRGLSVGVPADLEVTAVLDSLAAPVWKSATSGWLDAGQAVAANVLTWFVDPRAGGWRILRRQLTDLNTITTVHDPDNGVFTVSITGDQTPDLQVGATLFAGASTMGTILSVVYDTTIAESTVTLALPPDNKTVSKFWVGQVAATGAFQEVHRSSRTVTTGTQKWSDADVAIADSYEYMLQSYGFFDPTVWSPPSDVRLVRTGDTVAPGSIVFEETYPKVVDTLVRMKFTSPPDLDYAGVKVLYRAQFIGTASSATAATLVAPAASFPVTSLAGYTVRITGGTGVGQERTVLSNTTTAIGVDVNWLVVPDATSAYLVFLDTIITTNYGTPGALHSFTFEPHDAHPTAPIQLYLFPTFDFADNRQDEQTCESWLLDPADMVFSALYSNALITLVSSTPTTVTLKVEASSPDGTPQVRWNYVSGVTTCTSCTDPAGATLGTLVASGNQWTFTRPDALTHAADVGFEAVLTGAISDADTFTIAEQGRDTVTLQCKAVATSSDATTTTVSVTGTDPGQGGSTTPLTLHLEDTGGLAGGAITPTTDFTGTGTVTHSYVIQRPVFGSGTARVVYKVSSSDASKVPDFDSIDIVPQDRDTQYCQCDAKITNTTATTVEVTVTAQSNTGTPQVELVGVTGTAALVTGTAAGTYVAQNGTANKWVFSRGVINSGVGQAQFRAHLNGFEDDDAYIAIEEQGRDTIMLGIKAKVISTLADRVVVRVYAIDPFPQGANSVTIAYESQGTGAITAPSTLTLTPTASYTSTGYVDFTVFRPAFASGSGHFVVIASATSRTDAVDSVVVPEALQDTQPSVCIAKVTSSTASTQTITVTATHPAGAPQVKLVGLTGSATLASGTAAGTYVAQNGTANVWVFNRGDVDAGLGQAQFRAHISGTSSIPTVDDDDFVEIPDKGQDTRALTISLESVGSTTTTETVRVKVIDPQPQGTNTVSVAYFASGVAGVSPASGQLLTPTADFATTGYVDFVCTRASVGSDQGTVKFLATCANRVPDADSSFITATRKTTFGPSLNVGTVSGVTSVTFNYTFDGTLTYTIDGGTPTSVPTSPFSVSRPAVNAPDKTYTFICTKDSQTIQDTIVVSSKGDIPDLVIVQAASSASTVSYTISATNRGGGTAPTIALTQSGVTSTAGAGAGPYTIASGTTVVFTRPAFGGGDNAFTCVASIAGGGSETETMPVGSQERDTQYTECKARVISSTKTQCTVQVDAISPSGTPQVQLVSVSSPASLYSGTAAGTYVSVPSTWVFNLGDYAAAGLGQAVFRAALSGLQSDDDTVVLASTSAQPALDITAHVSSQTASTVTVVVTVADPYPQGAGSITLTVPVLSNIPSITEGGTTVTTAYSVTMDPGTAKTFIISRPAFNSGVGGVKWGATATGRTPDFDTVAVTEALQDSRPGRLVLMGTNYDSSSGLYYLNFAYFETIWNGNEAEMIDSSQWQYNITASATVKNARTGASASGVTTPNMAPFPPGPLYGGNTWYMWWNSTASDSWTVDLAVHRVGSVDPLAPDLKTTINSTIGASSSAAGGLDARTFGIVSSTTINQSSAVQAAFSAAASLNKYVDFGSMVVVLSSPVSCSGPGFVFDDASYGTVGQPGFYCQTGSGQVAITITGKPTKLHFCAYGYGQTTNLIYMQNPILANSTKIRAYNVIGYGLKIEKCWDSSFGDISVEQCGSSSEYAFSMVNGTDNCNRTTIQRLQVEAPLTKAIYIDPSSISLQIGLIHSEQLRSPNSSVKAWLLGGAGCSYGVIELTCNSPATSGKVKLQGARTTYGPLRGYSGVGGPNDIDWEVEAYGPTAVTIMTPDINGTIHELSGQSGRITVIGGTIPAASRIGNQSNFTYYNTL